MIKTLFEGGFKFKFTESFPGKVDMVVYWIFEIIVINS